ncbi:TraB/GumN family protein [Variovorax beijingensis]|uniref:TraB/GumN family protein n=1 Tax=Variovorax beijingensis TaxID=2496117 RepID=A0A3P3EM34_9BURK|nr:TraB/GumN family protein [Variovorax beijingensis]RRH87473.1 TraB/GumN family protein [Variovorax beijingensis]
MYYTILGTQVRILGSLHFFPESAAGGLPSRVEHALKYPDYIWLEHPPKDLAPEGFQPSGATLNGQIPPELWGLLVAAYVPDVLPDQLARLKLWRALLGLTGRVLKTRPGVEEQIQARLTQMQRRAEFIETAGELAALLDAVPLDDGIKALRMALDRRDLAQADFEALYAAWVQGDPVKVDAVMQTMPIAGISSMYEAVFERRNQTWAQRVQKHLVPAGQKILLVVGAGHLVGRGNLLSHLRAEGLESALIE